MTQLTQFGLNAAIVWQRDITRERCSGLTRCCQARVFDASLLDVLALFGLLPKPEFLTPITPLQAAAEIAALMHKDLAYQVEIMPLARAHALAAAFVAELAELRPQFYRCDGTFTESTFEGGVLARGGDFAACVWVQDED